MLTINTFFAAKRQPSIRSLILPYRSGQAYVFPAAERAVPSARAQHLGQSGISLAHLEWLGSGCGLLGAVLLALRLDISGYGFLLFLVSNVFWIAFALRSRHWGLLVMQAGFCATSLIGMCRWLS